MTASEYGSLPFPEQIAFFRNKRNVLTESYLDVWESEHDIGFMVAGANRDDLLADLREAVGKIIEDGATIREFRADFDRIVATHGWEYTGGRNWRTRVIYETNLRQSYNAGRWQQLQAVKRAMPYWRYRHSDAVAHPRPIHESWDGLTLDADDEWWLTHYPANGWGCQCYVEALSARDLRRLGKSGPDTAPPVNMQAVTIGQRSPGGARMVMTPEGVDPGFGYAPGRSLDAWPQRRGGPKTPPSLRQQLERTVQMALRKTLRLPARAAARSAAAVLGRQRAADAVLAGFVDWIAAARTRQVPESAYAVGAIAPNVVDALAAANASPASAAILVHAARLPEASKLVAAELSQLLHAPEAILLDPAAHKLYYVAAAPAGTGARGQVMLAVVRYPTDDAAAAGNELEKFTLVQRASLQTDITAGRLALVQGTLK